MSFHEVLFPVGISLNSEGGPSRRTEIVSLVSGHEERNSPWAASRRVFNAGYGVKSIADMETVIAFFEARYGRLYGFRFRDPFDSKSCTVTASPSSHDQVIGTGDGSSREFFLRKTYRSGPHVYVRHIKKPVQGSVQISVSGIPAASYSGYTADSTTGTVTFMQPPPDGAVITAGFEFDTPVRFDTDELRIGLAAFGAGDIPSIPLIEILV